MSKILQITRAEDILRITRGDFDGTPVSDGEFDHLLRLVDGLWLHSGDPKRPHAELTSGKCSDGFVDTLRLLKYPNICEILAADTADLYIWEDHLHPQWVIGSSYAAITFSFAVAHYLNAKHGFTEKFVDGDQEFQVWKRETIGLGEVVLQCEELVTTTKTLRRVRDGITSGTPVRFAPVILALVHRSEESEFDGRRIYYFRHYGINVWEPEECPLCAAGSKRLRPKHNWAELTQAA